MRRLTPALFPALVLALLALTDLGRAEVPGVFVASVSPATHDRDGSAVAALESGPENGALIVTVPPTSQWIEVAGSGDPLDHEVLASPAPTATAGLPDGKSLSGVVDAATDAGMVVASTEPGVRAPERPEAPTVVPAPVGGTATLLVSWSPPADNGSPITGYDVQWRTVQGGSSFTSDNVDIGPGTTATITGLASSTRHRVQVRASSAEGQSDWSRSGKAWTHNAPPTFPEDTPETVTVAENSVTVGAFPATDPDGDTLTYSLSGEDAPRFAIDSDGEVTVAGNPLDYETPADRTLTITVGVSDGKSLTRAADPSVDASAAVTIEVTDVLAPDVPTAPSVSPTDVGGTPGLLVSWTAPPDNGSPITSYVVRWRETPADVSEPFSETNMIIVPGAPATIIGLEWSTSYDVQVRAVGAGEKSAWSESGTAQTGQNVLKIPWWVTVAETATSFSVISLPPPPGVTLTYSLAESDASLFAVDSDGTVSVLSTQVLDYENLASPILTITITVSAVPLSSGDPYLYALQAVTITVTNVPPPNAPPTPTVSRIVAVGSPKLSVSWAAPTDNGSPITGYVVQWRETPDPASESFPETNTISVTGTTATIIGLVPLTSHDVRVMAVSAEGPSSWSESGTAQTGQHVLGISSRETVAENATSFRVIDLSPPDGVTLTYWLEEPDASRFAVDSPGTVSVLSTQALDYESLATPTLTITITASAGPLSPGVADIYALLTVTITVTDVPPPNAPPTPTVSPISAVGTPRLSVSWTAPADNGSPITGYVVQWRETPGTASESFPATNTISVTGTTATITGLAPSTSHDVQVKAVGAEGPSAWSESRTAQTGRQVRRIPLNLTLAENTTIFLKPITLSPPPDVTFTYSLSESDASLFAVDSDGTVSVLSTLVLDYESLANPILTITISVFARTLPSEDPDLYALLAVTITVTDVPPPSAPPTPTVSPIVAVGSPKLSVSWAAPADNGSPITGYVVQWRVTPGTASELFPEGNVISVTGTTATIIGLNPSTSHDVRVMAVSAEGESPWSELGTAQTGRYVLGISTRETVAENATSFRVIDLSPPDGVTLTYSLSGPDASLFAVHSPGTVSVLSTQALDYENLASPILTITITASAGTLQSGGEDIYAFLTVSITVTDVPPPNAPAAPTVTPANAGGTATLSVSWVAPADNGSPITGYGVEWRMKTDANSGTFTTVGMTIGTGTAVTITGLRSSTPHEVRVRATNAEGNSGWSALGEGRTHNAPPMFLIGPTVTDTVAENTDITVEFPAFDPDGDPLTYSTSGDTTLDYETVPTATVTVSVSDGKSLRGHPDSSIDASIVVTAVLTDIPPPDAPTTPTVTMPTVNGATTLSVSWRPPADNGASITGYVVQWRAKTDGNSGTWTPGNATGTVFTTTGLMSSTLYEVRVRAESIEGHSPWSGIAEGGTGNAPPTFSVGPTVTVTIAENTGTVGTFTATDPDNDTLTYSLSGASASRFGIDSGGTVTVAAGNPLDYETPADRALTVTVGVSDGRSRPGGVDTSVDASVVVVITVTDIPLPGVPSVPTVTAAHRGGTSNLVVRWTAPADNGAVITGYAVEWRVKTDGGNGTFTSDNVEIMSRRTTVGVSTARKITGLASSTTHEVRVRAESAEGNGDWSGIGEGRTNTSPPVFDRSTPVTLVEGSPTVGRFRPTTPGDATLTYSLSGEDASRFDIDSEGEVTVSGDPLDYETPADRTLAIVVEVSDGLSPSGAADPAIDTRISVTIVVTDIPPPGTPTTLSVNAPDMGHATTLSVTWVAPVDNGSPITAYTVEWREETSSNDGTFTSGGVNIAGTTAEMTGLASSTPYEVRVRADSDEGTGFWSQFGEGLTNPNLDLNNSGTVDRDDALIAYYLTEFYASLSLNPNTLRIVLQSLFPRGTTVNAEKAQETLAAVRRLVANPSFMDLNNDSVFDSTDALLFKYVLSFGAVLESNQNLCGIVLRQHGIDVNNDLRCTSRVKEIKDYAAHFGSD